jgi:hypothetical protein
MNDVTLPQAASSLLASPGAGELQAVLDRLDEPFRIIRRLQPWLTKVQNGRMHPWPLDRAAEFLDQALERHRAMPSFDELRTTFETLTAAADGETDEAKIRWLIGKMLSAMPSAYKFESASYVDTLVHMLMWSDSDHDEPARFSPQVIARAVMISLEEHEFHVAPKHREFIERCRRAKRALFDAIERIDRLLELRCNVEEIAIEAGAGDLVCGPDDDGFDDVKDWW